MDRVTTATFTTAIVSFLIGVFLFTLACLREDWEPNGISYSMAVGAGLFYVLPAAALYILGWRMGRADLWAYVCTVVLSFALLLKFAMAYIAFKADHVQFAEDPFFCEVFSRLPSIYLIVGCLNAMPDVRDAYRARQRDLKLARRGFEPLMPTGSALRPPPPPPATSIRRPGRPATRLQDRNP